MMSLTANTYAAEFRCLRDERMRQAQHQREVRQAIHNRQSRSAEPLIGQLSARQPDQLLSKASRP